LSVQVFVTRSICHGLSEILQGYLILVLYKSVLHQHYNLNLNLWPCLLINRNKMSNFYKGPFIDYRCFLSNLLCITRFWNNLHRVRSISKDWNVSQKLYWFYFDFWSRYVEFLGLFSDMVSFLIYFPICWVFWFILRYAVAEFVPV
jgi:hypothetical protein